MRGQLSQLQQTRRNTALCQPMLGTLTLCLLSLGPEPGEAPV